MSAAAADDDDDDGDDDLYPVFLCVSRDPDEDSQFLDTVIVDIYRTLQLRTHATTCRFTSFRWKSNSPLRYFSVQRTIFTPNSTSLNNVTYIVGVSSWCNG